MRTSQHANLPSPPRELIATLRDILSCLEQLEDADAVAFRESLCRRIVKLEAEAADSHPKNLWIQVA